MAWLHNGRQAKVEREGRRWEIVARAEGQPPVCSFERPVQDGIRHTLGGMLSQIKKECVHETQTQLQQRYSGMPL